MFFNAKRPTQPGKWMDGINQSVLCVQTDGSVTTVTSPPAPGGKMPRSPPPNNGRCLVPAHFACRFPPAIHWTGCDVNLAARLLQCPSSIHSVQVKRTKPQILRLKAAPSVITSRCKTFKLPVISCHSDYNYLLPCMPPRHLNLTTATTNHFHFFFVSPRPTPPTATNPAVSHRDSDPNEARPSRQTLLTSSDSYCQRSSRLAASQIARHEGYFQGTCP